MSSKALGVRLGMTAQGVRNLEQGEANGTLSLNTLTRLANGLDCEVHYVLVPRTSLVEQVFKRLVELNGTHVPTNLTNINEVLRDTEALTALSTLFAHVNKRGLWQ